MSKNWQSIAAALFCIQLSITPSSRAHDPHDVIDAVSVSPGFQEDSTVFVILSGKLMKSTNGGITWRWSFKGIDNKHFFSDISISPSYRFDTTVYAASNGSGVYRSLNGGDSWEKINNGLLHLDIAKIYIPSHTLTPSPSGFQLLNFILARTAHGRLYKTTDGGDSWHEASPEAIEFVVVGISYELNNSLIIFGGDKKGALYVSKDHGENWKMIFNDKNRKYTFLIIVPESSGNIILCGTDDGLLRSSDGGETFSVVGSGLSDKKVTSIISSPYYKYNKKIFLSTSHDIFISEDGGKTWSKQSFGLGRHQQADHFDTPHFREIAVASMLNRGVMLFVAGFSGLFHSIDEGGTWAEIGTISEREITGLSLSPDFLHDSTVALATHGGGAYISYDEGVSWSVINMGLESPRLKDSQFSEDGVLFTATNRSLYRFYNEEKIWDRIDAGYVPRASFRYRLHRFQQKIGLDGLWSPLSKLEQEIAFPEVISTSPNYANDTTVFYGSRYQGVFKSEKGGNSWVNIWRESRKAITAMVISPSYSSDRIVFVGVEGEGVYRSMDAGKGWKNVYELKPRSYRQPMKLAITPNYAHGDSVFLGTPDGLFRTSDGGDSWTEVPLAIKGVTFHESDSNYVTAIAISPDFALDKTLMVGVKGRGFYMSQDAGHSFYEPCGHCNAGGMEPELIEFSPSYSKDKKIFLSTGLELYRSDDRASTWMILERPVRYESDREVIIYRGQWEGLHGPSYSGGSAHRTRDIGSAATLRFLGSGISWRGSRSEVHGTAKIFLDGAFKEYIDLFREQQELMVEIYKITGLESGVHAIVIELASIKNPNSDGHFLEIDAFDVLP